MIALFFFFFNDTATTEIYTLSLHDALPICNLPSRSESATAEARRLHSLLTATCLRRSVGDGRRIGPGSVGMPYSRRRERRSGASTAGASAHPGSTPPRPQAALINSDRKSTRLNSSHLVISYAVF